MRAPTVPRLMNTEVPDPYPHQSGGQQLGVLEACPFKPLHVFWLLLFFTILDSMLGTWPF